MLQDGSVNHVVLSSFVFIVKFVVESGSSVL
jgi:hypothetical protein